MRELESLILEAQKVRNELSENEKYKREMAKNIESVNESINRAIGWGRSYTCFSVDYHYEDDIKKLFKSKGYSFRPTGEVGGVWQKTEDICW